jgi:zinc transport system substrate-binding protein
MMGNLALSFARRIRRKKPLLELWRRVLSTARSIASFLFLLVVTGWLPAASHAKPIRVAVSVFAIRDIVHRIHPESEIVTAIPPGANPHTFEPTPSLVRELQTVDCFLGVHPDFDGWIGRLLPKPAQTHWFIDSPEKSCLEVMNHPQGVMNHPQGVMNPHIWLSIQGARDIARKTAKAFMDLDPGRRSQIEENLAAFEIEMDSLRSEFQTLFDGLMDRRFIQWHPAWNDFAKEFDLDITGVIERGEGREPSIREIQTLIHDANETHTRVIVMEYNRTSRAADALRDAIHGRFVSLDGIGDPRSPERSDYPNLMRFNARSLAGALKRTENR